MGKKLFMGIFIVFAISVFFMFNRMNDMNTFMGESEYWKVRCIVSEQDSELEIKYKYGKEGFSQKFNFSCKFLAGKEEIINLNRTLNSEREKVVRDRRDGKYQGNGSDYKVIISWNGNEETINLKQK